MAAPVKQLSDGNPGGTGLGQSATDLISFYNFTPIAQRTSAVLSGTLSLFTNAGSSITYATAQFSSMWDAIAEIRNFLVAVGLHKGGA